MELTRRCRIAGQVVTHIQLITPSFRAARSRRRPILICAPYSRPCAAADAGCAEVGEHPSPFHIGCAAWSGYRTGVEAVRESRAQQIAPSSDHRGRASGSISVRLPLDVAAQPEQHRLDDRVDVGAWAQLARARRGRAIGLMGIEVRNSCCPATLRLDARKLELSIMTAAPRSGRPLRLERRHARQVLRMILMVRFHRGRCCCSVTVRTAPASVRPFTVRTGDSAP